MRRRLLLGLLTVALVLACASPATAYWQAGGAGAGQAPVGTLAAGARPTATLVLGTVTVRWAQTSFGGAALGGYSGGGYTVRRYLVGGGTAVTPGGSCANTISGTAATLSCQERNVAPGEWAYTITPVLHTWTGDEGARSDGLAVAPAAAILTSATAQNPAAGQTTGDIQLAWSSVSDATGYNVYRRTSSGTYDFSAPLNGAIPLTATSYADPGSGLSGASTYAYVVRALTSTLASTSSNELSATAIARPAAPAGVTATAAAGGRIAVGWSSVAGVAGYNVYRRTSVGVYDYATPLNGSTLVTATSFTDTTAVNAATYRYVIGAVSTGAGGARVESVVSLESAAVTADSIAPTAVTLTDPGSPLRGSVALSATASDAGSGIASLRFQRASAGGSTWTDGCSTVTAPYSCSLVTGSLTDGLHDLRVLAGDAAGNTTISNVVLNRRVDNTSPAVTMSDPGAFLRGTVTLSASVSDAGSGIASVTIQGAPTGSSTWTTVCTTTASPYSCAYNTTALANGGYDVRAIASDAAGNTTTSATVSDRVVDNTAPTAVDVQTTNAAGGIVAKPDTGDLLMFTFSEPMRPSSILAGWSGAATPVTVRFANGNPDVLTVWDPATGAQLGLGSATSGKKYVTATTTFTASNMVLSANTITVTLGTTIGSTSSATGTSTLMWTTSAAATDRAGNPLVAGVVTETGAADSDF